MKWSLMGFIDNHTWVGFKIRFIHKLSQQHTISHILNYCVVRCIILKPNWISNFFSQFDIHFLCHSCCNTHGCHSPGLSASYFTHLRISNFMKILRQLGGFAWSCFAHHYYHLIVSYQLKQLLTIFEYWQWLFYYLHWAFPNLSFLHTLLFFSLLLLLFLFFLFLVPWSWSWIILRITT